MAAYAFYETVSAFDEFARVVDQSVYRPVPDGSWLGITDVVNSTGAVGRGQYKAVNFAGVATISGLMNTLGHRKFPFIFGGDGAAFVAPPESLREMQDAVAATMTWVRENLGLELRGAMVPMATIRSAGHDLKIARFAASSGVSYAMFAGGGLAWGETEMKRGAFAISPAAAGTRPDLTGLSCRYQPLESRNGIILSLIVRPASVHQPAEFADLVRDLITLVEAAGYVNPVPPEGPRVGWPPQGFNLETRSSRGREPSIVRSIVLAGSTLLSGAILNQGRSIGRFDPQHYLRQNALNADFRKFDDGLKMTIDCSLALANRIEKMLIDGRQAGIVRFGLHRQSAAQITCVVPSVMDDEHFHFIDGADGGYTMAASRLA